MMNPPAAAAARSPWSTSAFGDAAEAASTDASALGEHLSLCRGLHGRLFRLRCAAERLDGFVASRFVTTLVVATLCIAAGALLA